MSFEQYLYPFLRVRKHYSIQIGETTFIYVYIRKNACSAFKNFIIGESLYSAEYDGSHALRFLRRYHKPRVGDFYGENVKSIVVVRDPYKRLISLFVNKFIQCSGNADIFNSYQDLVGRPPEQATFREFLRDYVASFSANKLDCHLLPQIDHMRKSVYTAPVRLEFLYEDMQRVVGEVYAEKYFKKKENYSSYDSNGDTSAYADISAFVLAQRYGVDGVVPSLSGFQCQDLNDVVALKYKHDLNLYEKLNEAYKNMRNDIIPSVNARDCHD